MGKKIKVIIYIILAASVFAASTFYFAGDLYKIMVAEDGIFENLTALSLLCISVLFLVRLVRTYKQRNMYWIALNVLIVLGAFFGFGEEISWGQRIFSIESGDFFTQNNLQNETNLHNLEVGGVKLNKLIFSQGIVIVFGFYFIFTQLFYRKSRFFKRLVDLFGVQIPKMKHSLLMLICTGLILIIPDSKIWELWEAIFVLLLLLVFIDPYNKKEKLIASSTK